jgi:hypothetical protein
MKKLRIVRPPKMWVEAQRYALFAFLRGSWCGEREFCIVGLLPRVIITRMSRLRRPVLSDRWFFITCRVLPRRRHLSDSEFATWVQVIVGWLAHSRAVRHVAVRFSRSHNFVVRQPATGMPFSIRAIR